MVSQRLICLCLFVTATIHPLPQALLTYNSDNDTITIDAREARPLRQAVAALQHHYGWIVDYEDPVFTAKELVDDTDPKWRVTHPTLPGVKIPNGQRFSFTAPAPSVAEFRTAQATLRVLQAMVDAYNKTENPGRFLVVNVSKERFAVVGTGPQESNGIFGREIVLATKTTTQDAALAAIFKAVSLQVGKKVGLGLAPMNDLLHASVSEADTTPVTARKAIAKLLDDAKLGYEALYNADTDAYIVNIHPIWKH